MLKSRLPCFRFDQAIFEPLFPLHRIFAPSQCSAWPFEIVGLSRVKMGHHEDHSRFAVSTFLDYNGSRYVLSVFSTPFGSSLVRDSVFTGARPWPIFSDSFSQTRDITCGAICLLDDKFSFELRAEYPPRQCDSSNLCLRGRSSAFPLRNGSCDSGREGYPSSP